MMELPVQQQESRQRRNLQVGVILAAVALAVSSGIILRFLLLGR